MIIATGESMFNRLLAIATLSFLLSGCYMVPMALIGPATSGFSTASLMQSGISTSASYLVKSRTGKTPGEHVFDAVFSEQIDEALKQTYLPEKNKKTSNSIRKNLNSFPVLKK